jgi:hypothetical protein
VPRDLPAGYFSSGVWAATGPLRLRHHTCVGCGHRATAWVAFQAHRRVCAGALEAPLRPPESWRSGGPDSLAELLAAAREEEAAEVAEAGPALDPELDPAPPGADARRRIAATRS